MTNSPIDPDLFIPAGPGPGSDRGEPALPASAGFFPRLMAFLIDLTVLAVLHCGCFILLGVLVLKFCPLAPEGGLRVIGVYLFFFCLAPFPAAMIYFVILPAATGLTLGKMMMGLRVVCRSGERFGPGLAFLRFSGYLLSALPLGAGFFWALFGRDHLCWHDRLAATVVIDEYFS